MGLANVVDNGVSLFLYHYDETNIAEISTVIPLMALIPRVCLHDYVNFSFSMFSEVLKLKKSSQLHNNINKKTTILLG